MDTSKSIPPVIPSAPLLDTPYYPVPYLWAALLITVLVSIYIGLEYMTDLSTIQVNWAEYRCQPQIMPLAGLFGHDVNENFQFCLQQVIQENTKGVAAPFAQGMSGFTGVLMNLMNSANSFRVMLATLVGGVIKIVSEFQTRMTALMSRVKLAASRMKAMMYRIYGTMFAVMYMGMSAQTAISNFGDSFIYSFIDTFCFPPEQLIRLKDGSQVPIVHVKVGDILKGGHTVESTYRFAADGQPMVQLGDVTVSSNHFVRIPSGRWKMARDHPDAVPIAPWSGPRPLICLSTHDHILPIGGYIFADYDETEKGDAPTQQWVHRSLNGRNSKKPLNGSYEVGSPPSTRVKTVNGYKRLDEIQLGDMISATARVVGIQNSTVSEVCVLGDSLYVAKGSLVWNELKGEWIRAYTEYPTRAENLETIALFVSPGAQYELEEGYRVRDAMEIYSPETKRFYAEALLKDDTVTLEDE